MNCCLEYETGHEGSSECSGRQVDEQLSVGVDAFIEGVGDDNEEPYQFLIQEACGAGEFEYFLEGYVEEGYDEAREDGKCDQEVYESGGAVVEVEEVGENLRGEETQGAGVGLCRRVVAFVPACLPLSSRVWLCARVSFASMIDSRREE